MHGTGTRLSSPIEVAPNHWRWEIKDMQKLDLRDVKASPDWAALAARMSVQWGDAAVEGKDNQWRALGVWVTDLEANRPDPIAGDHRRNAIADCRGAGLLHQTQPHHRIHPEKHPLLHRRARHRRIAGAPCSRHLSQSLWRLQRQDHAADLDAAGGRNSCLLRSGGRPPRRCRSGRAFACTATT